MSQDKNEICSHCMSEIPSSEKACVFEGWIVCEKCDKVLRGTGPLPSTVSGRKTSENPYSVPQKLSDIPLYKGIVLAIFFIIIIPLVRTGCNWLTDPVERGHRSIDRVWKTMPANACYQNSQGMTPNYVDPVHGFFSVYIPSICKPIPQVDNTTFKIESGPKAGTIVSASRITFNLDKSSSTSVVVRETFVNEIELQEMESMLRKAQDKFNTPGNKFTFPYRHRWAEVDGTKAFEGMIFVSNGKGLAHLVKFKKDGLDHTITFVCSRKNYSKHQKAFVEFLQTYQSTRPHQDPLNSNRISPVK